MPSTDVSALKEAARAGRTLTVAGNTADSDVLTVTLLQDITGSVRQRAGGNKQRLIARLSLCDATVVTKGDGVIPPEAAFSDSEGNSETLLPVGTRISGRALLLLAAASERYAALRTTLSVLECGDNSIAALRRKLRTHRYSEAASEYALRLAIARGWIDEERQLRHLTVLCAEGKRWGPARLTAALVAKGYRVDDIRRVIDEQVSDGTLDFEKIRAHLLADIDGSSEEDARRLLYKNGFRDD